MKSFLFLVLVVYSVQAVAPLKNINFTDWNDLLKENVNVNGKLSGVKLHSVHYKKLGADQRFYDTLDMIANADIEKMTKNQTIAFHINAYNALAAKMIVQNPCRHDIFGDCGGCLKSIRDIGLSIFYKPVWDMFAGKVGGTDSSLDDVEAFLRDPEPFSEDPRIHASIVCASISCPNLRNEAFDDTDIDSQLQSQMEDFLNNTKKGLKLDKKTKTLTLSSIFDWFASDFESHNRTVVDFILPFIVDKDTQDFVEKHQKKLTLEYFDYDWDVNAEDLYACNTCSTRPCFPFVAVLATIGICLLVFLISVVLALCCWRRSKTPKYQPIPVSR